MRKLAALLIAAALLAGCGTSEGSDSSQVEGTVLGYLTDLAEGDGQGACDRLSGEEARRLLDEVLRKIPELRATSCVDAIDKLSDSLGGEERKILEEARIDRVEVDGGSATATIVGGTNTARLRKVDGVWVISGGIRLG
ncbi:MAG: hypothetical protein AB7L91_17190 [Dehalococcoidia bacterium]